MAARPFLHRPRIDVLAGVNGAGKSSVLGAIRRSNGADYFNPDEASRELRARNPSMPLRRANIVAWELGRSALARAIDEGTSFAFETTLGGSSIAAQLKRACELDRHHVTIAYVGLRDVDQHIERVAKRRAEGGHDIPEADIRRRFRDSPANLAVLVHLVDELAVFDNSDDDLPPRELLRTEGGRVVYLDDDAQSMPAWFWPLAELFRT